MMRALLLSAAALVALPAAAQDIAIINAKLVIGDGSAPVEGGTVVVRGGKVVAAGAGVAVPAGIERVDAQGKYVTPGIVAAFSRVGLVEVDAVDGTNDRSANRSRFSAGLDIAPARAFDVAPKKVRSAGVTPRSRGPELIGPNSTYAAPQVVLPADRTSTPGAPMTRSGTPSPLTSPTALPTS